LANLTLIGVYAVLIRWMTPDPPAPLPVRRPRLELVVALVLFCGFVFTQLLHFDVWTVQPWHSWVRRIFQGVYRAIARVGGIPDWARQDVFLAVSSTLKQLIPTLLALALLGHRSSEMGLARPHWRLVAALLGLTTLFGLATGALLRTLPGQALVLYGAGILINALPEELFFRGFLLPRLERMLGNPLNALVASALLFNALHVPIELSRGTPLPLALLGTVSIGYPSGLIWGYLYLRTRSVLPGTLWHAANGTLGYILMSV
jgi:membrane protease YdiL (CAAX protease family)